MGSFGSVGNVCQVQANPSWETGRCEARTSLNQRVSRVADQAPHQSPNHQAEVTLDKAKLESAALAARALDGGADADATASATTDFILRGFKIEMLR